MAILNHFPVDVPTAKSDDGNNPFISIGRFDFDGDRLSGNFVVEGDSGFFPPGLSRFVRVSYFRGVDAVQPDLDLSALFGETCDSVAVRDLLNPDLDCLC